MVKRGKEKHDEKKTGYIFETIKRQILRSLSWNSFFGKTNDEPTTTFMNTIKRQPGDRCRDHPKSFDF